jgi:hypothetical protein
MALSTSIPTVALRPSNQARSMKIEEVGLCWLLSMAKSRKKDFAPKAPPPPQVGDKVKPGRSVLTYEIFRVHYGGNEVDLHVPGTNLQRFRERVDNLIFVERKHPARTSNPFTTPEPVINAGEVLECIRRSTREPAAH